MNLHRHLHRHAALVISVTLSVSVLSAQFGTEAVVDQDLGRPPQAPFITFLGIVAFGKVITDPSLPPAGPVAEVVYEELRAQKTPAGSAGEVVTSIKTRYDQEGHRVEEIRKEWGSETNTVYRYEATRVVSEESTFPNSRQPRPKFWNYWIYDQFGKLTEYRRGSGDKIQNHVTNFKRDDQGRLVSFEYREGPRDELASRTGLRYSGGGKTVDYVFYDPAGEVTRSTTQTGNDRRQVVLAVIRERDWQTKKPKTPLSVAFRYDEKGRLVEQNTGAHEFEKAGSEHELPPGKVSITYDDVKRTKTTAYSSNEGLIDLTVTRDENGATIGISGGTKNEPVDVRIECSYDSHKNWTNCQQMVKSSGVSTVAKIWHQTITYR